MKREQRSGWNVCKDIPCKGQERLPKLISNIQEVTHPSRLDADVPPDRCCKRDEMDMDQA